MKTPYSLGKSVPRIVLSALLMLPLAARVYAASGYTITEILNSTTPIPGEPGKTFTGFAASSNQQIVTDGTTVAFTNQENPGAEEDNPISVWALSVTGGTPIRLADLTTPIPGQTAYTFVNFLAEGVGGGMVVFEGLWSGGPNFQDGSGLYAAPVGGGAIVKLADTYTALPASTDTFGLGTTPGNVAVHGSQVLFKTTGGIYIMPVTGGTITRVGDSTTPLVDPLGTTFVPNGSSDANTDGQQLDFGGGQAVFLAAASQGGFGLFSGPTTGLTVGANGVVDNATFIADENTPVPGGTAGFSPGLFSAFADDSGTPVFFGSAASNSFGGLYSYVNGAIAVLADSHTIVAGQTTPLTSISDINSIAVGGGEAYFEGTLTDSSGNGVSAIFAAPVVGGQVVPVVTSQDSVPGASGSTLEYPTLTFGGVGAGKVAFQAGYGSDVTGIFIATPGSGTGPTTNTLTLSSHLGGNTGVVTVTATTLPGAPAIVSGATVTLTATGKPTISAKSIAVDATGSAVTALIDLTGKATGVYDFVVTNPDGTIFTQAASFTIETGVGTNVYADLLGLADLRAGEPRAYTILVGNTGDIDAASVPVVVTFPSYFTCQVTTPLITPRQPTGFSGTFDYSQIPVSFASGDHNVLPLIVPKVPAGGVATVQVLFTCPDVKQYAHVPFTLGYQAGDPLINAATGGPASGESSSAYTGGPQTDAFTGPHTDFVGLPVTCFDSFVSILVDCTSVAFPEFQIVGCLPSLLAAGGLGYIGIASDSATDTNSAIAYGQAGAGLALAALQCGEKVGLKLLPGYGTVVNTIQCGVDTYLLATNCLKPGGLLPGQTIVSGDPNDLVGSVGDGSSSHYLTGTQPLRYGIYFENEATASAPAQSVTITDTLDPNLDLTTFSFGPISFGSTLLNPPAGSTNYSATVDLRPATDLLVQVTAALNATTRVLSYSFQSINPATGQPTTNPTIGFLPPDTNPPAGDGFVAFYVKPKTGLATGSVVKDQASIVFDVNAPIPTSVWVNTIDNTPPKSSIAALPKTTKHAHIPLKIKSSDKGSGVSYFNIYASEDGSKFQPVIKNALNSDITFTGITDHSYAFYSQAVDRAGNVEALKPVAEARTKITGPDLIGDWKGEVKQKKLADGATKLKGTFAVKNQSTGEATTAGSMVVFHLSDDATLSAHDRVLGDAASFGPLGPGESVEVSLKDAKLPAGVSALGKFVIAVIDPGKTVPETDFTNNTVAYGPLQ